MRNFKRLFVFLVIVLSVEFALIACITTGVLNPTKIFNSENKASSQTTSSQQKSDNEVTSETIHVPVPEEETIEKSQEVQKEDVKEEQKEEPKEDSNDVSTVLKINLTGSYLNAYNAAVDSLGKTDSDFKKKLVVKTALQILQSKTIKYENQLHFYSLSYSASGGTPKAKCYSLKNCIDRINAGKTIYTDCFGFVRLAHSIAAYTISPKSPESVSGLNGLYGYKGSYTGNNITNLNKLKPGAVIYDRLTGSGSSKNRHVAMFLYSNGKTVTYIDQGGIFTGEYKYSSYIYHKKSNPYKFNTFKSYC